MMNLMMIELLPADSDSSTTSDFEETPCEWEAEFQGN